MTSAAPGALRLPADGAPVLVVGFAVTGEAVARTYREQGVEVIAVDDRAGPDLPDRASRLGVLLIESPDRDALDKVVSRSGLAVVSPGVPDSHPVFSLCAQRSVPVTTEIEIAGALLGGSRRLVAVTGTNGKTTVVTLIHRMLETGGIPATAAGNIGVPMLDACRSAGDVVVVETSSFQLALTEEFRPDVAVWLNVSPDHLDAHASMEAYVAAKERIWANQRATDVAVVNAADPVVVGRAAHAPSRLVTFGGEGGDFRVERGRLLGPGGAEILPVRDLMRSYPHDVDNALAATAAAAACGVSGADCAETLRGFDGLRHRIELVAEIDGVRYFDDSKATTPASVVAAVSSFDSVVLIAGGRNKGLDLGVMATRADRCRGVIAIGESSAEVESAFRGYAEVATADSMATAVREARSRAHPGDVVLLSPGCASFDWYRSYAERGDDFARLVRDLVREPAT